MNDLFNWLKTRQIELHQLMDIEISQKKVLLPQVNHLNETLFLYNFEEQLLRNLEQLVLLKAYIDSDVKVENYDFFTYVYAILKNIRESMSFPDINLYSKTFYNYFDYLRSVFNELESSLVRIEQEMKFKYDSYLYDNKNSSYRPNIEYSWTIIAEKFSIKCSGHLERLSLLQAYEQDWKICKTCHAFICPTCASNFEACPNLARTKHKLDLIGLPLENIINFLQTDNQRNKLDDSFIIMDKSESFSH